MKHSEIVPGLSSHLDPIVLQAGGGTFTCGRQFRVLNDHRFLCISVSGGVSTWLPLYSRNGPGRLLLTKSGRTGDPSWTSRILYYHPEQKWTAPIAAVIAAAQAAGEQSKPGKRSMLSAAEVARIVASLNQPSAV